MKKIKLGVLGLMTVTILSFGLNGLNFKEQTSSEIKNVILVQYEHGRGI
ncbi:Phr family secreted Rap phosphatase inhibitor [Bacillus thuringiensis]|nr:Phr family secreted Rap phosphatase inhibitor [Bacillus thuringiensis]MDO6634329.1 Phr family secreted Rap phosphatase inhibitor [Bacillus thuringiensis]MDO6663564.1 Phr family secreted Rap phosphatase inhibitor [Bacillus thuringiensis]MDO6704481.1 Phr family secreted Rap phosphatase inhibitor [Bacillus thuringiensis]